MPKLELVIGNKNYSSWSMRPWLALRQAAIPFTEIQLKFNGEQWEKNIARLSPSRRVPVLWIDDQPVWDSLAILETIAELFPEKNLLPQQARARQVARSIMAEMHSGFGALRSKMPMNIRGSYPGKGLTPDVQKDIDRIVALWSECRKTFGENGALLFGHFTVVDAMYAPVVTRFMTYAVSLPTTAQAYCEAVQSLSSVQEWSVAARAEPEVVPEDEPYATV